MLGNYLKVLRCCYNGGHVHWHFIDNMNKFIFVMLASFSALSWANNFNEFMISSECVDRVEVERSGANKVWQVNVYLNETTAKSINTFTQGILGQKLSIVTPQRGSLGLPPSTVHAAFESSFRLYGYPTLLAAQEAITDIHQSAGACGAIPGT